MALPHLSVSHDETLHTKRESTESVKTKSFWSLRKSKSQAHLPAKESKRLKSEEKKSRSDGFTRKKSNKRRHDGLDGQRLSIPSSKSEAALEKFNKSEEKIEETNGARRELNKLDVKELIYAYIADYECFLAFRKFLWSVRATENADFIAAVLKLRALACTKDAAPAEDGMTPIQRKCSSIYHMYIVPDAVKSLNLSHKTVAELNMKAESSAWDVSVYDTAADEIVRLLENECWKEYLSSPFYTELPLNSSENNSSPAKTSHKDGEGVRSRLMISPPSSHR